MFILALLKSMIQHQTLPWYLSYYQVSTTLQFLFTKNGKIPHRMQQDRSTNYFGNAFPRYRSSKSFWTGGPLVQMQKSGEVVSELILYFYSEISFYEKRPKTWKGKVGKPIKSKSGSTANSNKLQRKFNLLKLVWKGQTHFDKILIIRINFSFRHVNS